jgi:DNA-binding transcriptional regulator YdaS (Cro superfamily)
MATIHFDTLRRASEIIGDDKVLADMLGVNERLLAWWKSEEVSIPKGVFFMCVDIVVSDAVHQNSHQ